jgi:hypothetical protein
VPADEREASSLVKFLKAGPFRPEHFHAALALTLRQLGPGRPLQLLLQHLQKRILPNPDAKENRS